MKKSVANFLLTAATIGATPAWAQDFSQPPASPPATATSAAEEGGIGDIVVTARRREESAQTVPIAITALSGEFLQKRAVADLTDLNSYVPSLRVSNFNTPVKLTVAVRGQRQS